ncbi:MAG: pantetheine-phosphate adenylyltransferase [Tannerella sp.]|jgi:pantetheine-phosphate adenylyltransferase|nr:pantetheine-phosphate adenylyltransferase [Tannerella sp.]
MKKAIFPGSFDPFTTGHYALVKRALAFTDEIVIAIGVNIEKKMMFTVEERIENIRLIYNNNPRVQISVYENLTADFAKEINADYILRGVRNITDFEYEKNMADINRKLAGIETVILFSEPEYGYVSSNLVRELKKFDKDITSLIPKTK